MQPLRKEEAFAGLERQAPNKSMDLTNSQDSFKTFAGLLLGTALGLYCWAALLLLFRWVF
jgi:hypothetical protein